MCCGPVPLTLLTLTSLWCSCGTSTVSVSVTPGRSVFEGGYFVLKCDSAEVSDDWSVFRNTTTGPEPRRCGQGWGKRRSNGCKVGLAVQWDSGLYWCQSAGGAVSNTVWVSVSGGTVVVELPLLPVFLGDDVIVRCLDRTYSSTLADFYRDDQRLTSDPVLDLPLVGVSALDRGSYQCRSGDGGNKSSAALLQVINQTRQSGEFPSNSTHSEPDSAHLHLSLRLVCHLLVFCPYCISTVLMVSLCRQRKKGHFCPGDERPEVKSGDCEDAVTTEYHF